MVEWKKLGEVCKTVSPPKKLEKELYGNVGLYPIIDQGQKEIVGFTDDLTALLPYGEYVLFGDHTRFVKYYRGKFAQGADGLKILKANESIIPRYFFYAFDNTEVPSRGYSRHWSIAKQLLIPIPSLSEQQRIVSILDTFTSSISNLKQQIEERRKQYEYERDLLLDLEGKEGVEMKKLGEVFDTRNGYTPSTKNPDFWEEGTIPWFKMEDIRDNGRVLGDSNLHITPKAIKGKGLFKANSIILATSATIGEHALITVKHLSNQRFTNFYPKKKFEGLINMKFVYYYMYLIDEWCKQHINQGGFASVDMNGLFSMDFPLLSLQAQFRIVSILDTFEQSISNLEEQLAMREKQYEYYRNQLLTFEGEEERGKT
ncbi:MAG: restriction endonuclease subunit S [Bacteroidaceae bacterium]